MVPDLQKQLKINALNGSFPINQNFELNKSRQKFHYSLKEHHKISNNPKFRCKMLWNADNIALRSLQFSVILDYKREMVTTSVRNTKWLKITNFAWLYIISILQHFATKLWNIANFVMLFQAVMKFLFRLV
jgi:hypothetical protein